MENEEFLKAKVIKLFDEFFDGEKKNATEAFSFFGHLETNHNVLLSSIDASHSWEWVKAWLHEADRLL